MNITTTLATVQSSARTHQNPETRLVSQEETLPVGCTIRQGDVMLTRHALKTKFKETAPTQNRQLAPGVSIGSRHVLRGGPEVLTRLKATALQGPIVVAPQGFYLEHPTHGDIDCRLPGVYEVTYPRDFAAEGLQRRRD
jgi:hypothetical protein